MQQNWSQLISAFRKSGQTHQSFCSVHKLPLTTFQYHLYKKSKEPDTNTGSFVRLIPLAEQQNSKTLIEFNLGNGRTIKLPADYPINSLCILLKMVVQP